MSILVERLALEGTISSITTLNIVSVVYCSDPSKNNAEMQVSGNVAENNSSIQVNSTYKNK